MTWPLTDLGVHRAGKTFRGLAGIPRTIGVNPDAYLAVLGIDHE